MEKAIIIKNLSRNFTISEKKEGVFSAFSSLLMPKKRTTRALREISFSVDQGELVGFIGPNGAGKTTTLKILSGVLHPSGGFTQVLGHDPWERKPEYLKQISLIAGNKNQLWWDLPARETFKLNKAIYEIGNQQYKQTLSELLEMLDAEEFVDLQVRRLSLGQRMRCELIAALLHRPKVLFLDEPTIGLDVVGQQSLREFIKTYNKKRGSTIILTSHNMDDVLDLAQRVIVINRGEIMFDGKIKKLISGFVKEKIIRVFLSKEYNIDFLKGIGKIKSVSFPEIVISVPRKTVPFAASEILQNLPVIDINIEEESLDNIVRRIFRDSLVKSK